MKRGFLSLLFLLSFVLLSSPAFAQTDLTGATITLTPTEYDYNGTPCTPKVSGIRKGTKRYNSLVEGVDYDLSYEDNINAGSATATLVFKGNYTGIASNNFSINPKDLSREESVALELSVIEVDYDGTKKTPSASDMYDDEKLLVPDVDYDLVYSNNSNPGTATVTANFKGNYGGSKKANFTIIDGGKVPPSSLTVNYFDSSEATPQVERVMTYAEFHTLLSSFPNAIAIAPKGFDVWPLDKPNVVMEDEEQNYSCGIFTLTDEKDFYNVAPITVKTLSYSRALAEGVNTCFLPFAVGIADFPEGTKMYRLVAEAEYANMLVFTPIESADAGTPFLVVSPAACTWNISVSDAMLESSITNSSHGNRAFVGTYLPTDEYKYADSNPYFGLSDSESKFVPLEETLSPFRACIKVSNSEPSQANLGYKIVLSAASPEETYLTGVEYVDATGTATTTVEGVKVYVLDGSETTLGIWGETTWYVCQTPATENDGKGLACNGEITLIGDVRIILADGNKMSVTNTGGSQCFSGGSAFYIYGQKEGTGILDLSGAYSGIYSNCNMTICGGNITASGDDYGIDVYGSVTVTGGTVTAIGTNGNGIFAHNGDITLDWTNTNDFIQASSYNVGSGFSVNIPAGKYFYDTAADNMTFLGNATNPYVFGEGSNATLNDIAGKRLVPAMPFEASKSYVVNTFEGNWKGVGGAKTFLPTGYNLSTGQVTLTEVKGAPDGQPVIIGLEEGQNLPATCFLVSAQGDEVKDDYDDVVGNMSQRFVITDGTKTLAEVISATGVDASEAIILVLTNGRFTSVDFSDDDLEKLAKPGLLLFVLTKWEYMQIKPNQSAAAPIGVRTIGIGNGQATGITTTDFTDFTDKAGAWHDLQGRKFQGEPTSKGIYIYKGKKVIIK